MSKEKMVAVALIAAAFGLGGRRTAHYSPQVPRPKRDEPAMIAAAEAKRKRKTDIRAKLAAKNEATL